MRLSMRDDLSTNEYRSIESRIHKIGTSLVATRLPVEEMDSLKEEVKEIKNAMGKVNQLTDALKSISGAGASYAQNALNVISKAKISHTGDVEKLLLRINDDLKKIRGEELRAGVKEKADSIGVIEGAIRGQEFIRDQNVATVSAARSFRVEILKAASDVLDSYSNLRSAE